MRETALREGPSNYCCVADDNWVPPSLLPSFLPFHSLSPSPSRCFAPLERVDALGFALMRRKTGGLKDEYRDLDGRAIGALK